VAHHRWTMDHPPESKLEMISRIRREADSAEEKARQLTNLSSMFARSNLHGQILQDAESLRAEAFALRQHADGLEIE
jgi:hypothetical protein